MFTLVPPIRTAVFLARIVIPFSRSKSIESSTRSATSWLSRNEPLCQSRASTSVVLPWSTWATIATLRRSSRCAVRLGSDIAITLAVDSSVQFRQRAVAALCGFPCCHVGDGRRTHREAGLRAGGGALRRRGPPVPQDPRGGECADRAAAARHRAPGPSAGGHAVEASAGAAPGGGADGSPGGLR